MPPAAARRSRVRAHNKNGSNFFGGAGCVFVRARAGRCARFAPERGRRARIANQPNANMSKQLQSVEEVLEQHIPRDQLAEVKRVLYG